MSAEQQGAASISDINLRSVMVTFFIAVGVSILAASAAQAQTFQVIHNFTGGADGANPLGRLSIDGGGHLYGTTYSGGTQYQGGQGVVFRMSPEGSSWMLSPIYIFSGHDPGDDPANGVVFGPDGILYGTTSEFDNVFTLRPSATRPKAAYAPWTIDFLYSFPWFVFPGGDLIFDSAGNIYGATVTGGNHGCFNNEGCGAVYELTPIGRGGWLETPLYIFQGGTDGEYPQGVTFDSAGNLIGTTELGGAYDRGAIFKLTPSDNSWTESVLYNFDPNGPGGYAPEARLISDAYGNFYGSTTALPYYSGTVFEFSPSNDGWTYTVLAQIPSQYRVGPAAPLTMDAAGNLYGTAGTRNSLQPGAVFKVTPGSDGWTFTSLHDFTGGSDGGSPSSTVAIDAKGNLYGTTYYGGPYCLPSGCGVVWEITP